jgi:hypothetical protein
MLQYIVVVINNINNDVNYIFKKTKTLSPWRQYVYISVLSEERYKVNEPLPRVNSASVVAPVLLNNGYAYSGLCWRQILFLSGLSWLLVLFPSWFRWCRENYCPVQTEAGRGGLHHPYYRYIHLAVTPSINHSPIPLSTHPAFIHPSIHPSVWLISWIYVLYCV